MKSETLSLKIGFPKENSCYYSMRRLKKIFIAASKQINRKILDLGNAKEHHQLFIRKKGTKSVKQ